jgi:alpha-glucuronidase
LGAEIKGRVPFTQRPRYALRVLDHWDNLDGSVERGYAGKSLWKWDELPGTLDPRYTVYARANASIGINGVVLNNVNASPLSLSSEYLKKTAALADLWRPYGIRVYLTANFASPRVLGKLKTADPLDPQVIGWWKAKADEIYQLIPDFGGFLVKANSEGQPGPQDYHRTHADGANLLAGALAPHGGIVMWRAFVYDAKVDADRAKRAYKEFVPLDGKFRDNVIVQVKNGPIDFQPREPVHPLFAAIKRTRVMAELQITQENLGQAKHLVYLARGRCGRSFAPSTITALGRRRRWRRPGHRLQTRSIRSGIERWPNGWRFRRMTRWHGAISAWRIFNRSIACRSMGRSARRDP